MSGVNRSVIDHRRVSQFDKLIEVNCHPGALFTGRGVISCLVFSFNEF